MASPAQTLARVKKRQDFLAANSGARVVTPAFILLVSPNSAGQPRLGFTTSRKVGNAVARNRARRRLREVARAALADAKPLAADHIFIARALPAERPYAALLADARDALARAARKSDPARAARKSDPAREARKTDPARAARKTDPARAARKTESPA